MDDMEKCLNSFDPAVRKAALEKARSIVFNLHCHSFFSYNGYGYSPTKLAVLAKQSAWRAVGMVDFDVLDGVDEFLSATKALGVPAVAGMETRVFIPELAEEEINSPGEPGIAYHLGYGFKSTKVPASAAAFAAELREKAGNRTRTIIQLVNGLLSEIALDFDAVAKSFTPAGNVTERHVCQAYRAAAEKKFPSAAEREAYWKAKIGVFDADPVKMEAAIRSKTMKRGGIGYMQPKPESFPTLADQNKFIEACGAVPTVAWLNGLSKGESDPGRLLDLHMKYGARAITIIPDRNWNVADEAKRKTLTDAMDRFIEAANERKLPILAGTEMNAPGQKLADDFTVPALAKHLNTFLAGADALI